MSDLQGDSERTKFVVDTFFEMDKMFPGSLDGDILMHDDQWMNKASPEYRAMMSEIRDIGPLLRPKMMQWVTNKMLDGELDKEVIAESEM